MNKRGRKASPAERQRLKALRKRYGLGEYRGTRRKRAKRSAMALSGDLPLI